MRRLGMLIFCTQVCVFLASLIAPTVHAAPGCPAGWFGDGCRLRCNCEQSHDCGVGGLCPNNGECKSPYFSRGCQYVDSLLTHASANTPMFVRDRNHSTCNPDPSATSLQLSLSKPQTNMFFTIYASNNITLFYRNFTVKVDQVAKTEVKTFYILDTNSLEVRLYSNTYTLTNLTIQGPVVPYICTINISKGRNVALKQRVSQSSNYSRDPLYKVRAENAIDGNTNPDYESGSCSHTEFENGTYPYWNITFDRPYWFHRINIYNTKANMEWLSGFSLSMHPDVQTRFHSHQDNETLPLHVYTIPLSQENTVRVIRIEAGHSPHSRRVLILCEVELYVETSCPNTKYGLDCEFPINCKGASRSVTAGTCQHIPHYYCPPGTHGELCELICSQNCLHHLCDARSGACSQCVAGYLGEFCNQVCELGTYGLNCSLTCSDNCAGPCSHINGSCTCFDHFAGDLCTDCQEGWSGENCSSFCPRICPSRECDNNTGQCSSCVGRRTGPKCEDCPPHYYGALCDLPCSVYCMNRSCNKVNGYCYRCVDGFYGEFCSREKESVYPSFWLLPLIIPFVVMLVFFCIVGGGDTEAEGD